MLTAPSSPGPETEAEERPLATAELSLGGMHCGACAARIEGALADQVGVVSASVNLATTRAFVAYDPTTTGVDDLCGAVDGAGYTAAPVEQDDGAVVRERSDHWGLRAAISWPLALAALVVSLAGARDRERGRRLDRARPGRRGRDRRRVAVPAHDGTLAAPGGDEHGHAHRPGYVGRPGRERGGGHRPARPALPPRRGRRIRGAPARGHGAVDRGHPRHRSGHRGPGPATGGAGHAFAARVAAAHGPGGGGRRRRSW